MFSLNNKTKGILLIISSSFFFALMGFFVKLAGDLPSMEKSFFRNLVSLCFAAIIALKNKMEFIPIKSNISLLLLRSLFGTIGILCNFYAVDHLLLADASILNKVSPFVAIIFSFFILNEKIKPFHIMAILGAFVGTIFVVKPSFENVNMLSALIGLAGGICSGLAYTLVRKISTKGVKGYVIVLFFSSFSVLTTFPLMMMDYVKISLPQLSCLLLAGLAATGGQFSVTGAYSYAAAKEISIYDYSQIIFSAALGFIFFKQIPDIYSFVGYFIIVIMAVLMYIFNNKTNKNR